MTVDETIETLTALKRDAVTACYAGPMPTFTRPQPAPVSFGFTAGVLRIVWLREPPVEISGRAGLLFPAQITECATRTWTLPRNAVNQALVGMIVRSPDGKLSQITGIESHATMGLGIATTIGVLLVPVDET